MVDGKVDSQISFGARSEKLKNLFGASCRSVNNLFGVKWQLWKNLVGSQRVKQTQLHPRASSEFSCITTPLHQPCKTAWLSYWIKTTYLLCPRQNMSRQTQLCLAFQWKVVRHPWYCRTDKLRSAFYSKLLTFPTIGGTFNGSMFVNFP